MGPGQEMLQRLTKGRLRTQLKKSKPQKMQSLADEMRQLTVGCMELEEEGGCTSPR